MTIKADSMFSLMLQQQWQEISNTHWHVVVAGGGITGAGVALEAARMGLNVLLLERQDFSWGTSSRSSKMVHGGLRYMAAGDFKTTRDSVHERERLLSEAPGLVELMTYVMPHYKKQFPPPFIFNALLWFYDLFAGKKYRKFISAARFKQQYPFIQGKNLIGATEFADAVTDDSRLVMRVLHEAVANGAVCLNYVGVEELLESQPGNYQIKVKNYLSYEQLVLNAEVVINATGVWVDELRGQLVAEKRIRPSRGSHIVLPSHCLPVSDSLTILHPDDKRPIFIYPWHGCTVVGTTDLDQPHINNTEAVISQQEMDYLLGFVGHYFPQANVTEQTVISSFSGVRPLVASGALTPSKEKRTHSVWDDNGLISVSGGKLTTFRLIAQDALKHALKYLNVAAESSFSAHVFDAVQCQHPALNVLPEKVQRRLQGYYGAQLDAVLSQALTAELEMIPNSEILWAELRWSLLHEAVQHLDDLLLRRFRFGLVLSEGGFEFEAQLKLLCQETLQWSDERWLVEKERYQAILQQFYRLPKNG